MWRSTPPPLRVPELGGCVNGEALDESYLYPGDKPSEMAFAVKVLIPDIRWRMTGSCATESCRTELGLFLNGHSYLAASSRSRISTRSIR